MLFEAQADPAERPEVGMEGVAGFDRYRANEGSGQDDLVITSYSIHYTKLYDNYAASSWSGELIRQHLYDLFGVDMSVRQCQRLLRKLREVKN